MRNQITPSMMCADFLHMEECLRSLEGAGADYLHIDVMDGTFVPNYTLGTDFVKKLKNATGIPLDLHLMITEPERKLDWFAFGEGDYVSVHAEATAHLHRTLAAIHSRGAKAMAAINPATPISAVEEVLDEVDAILVMTVNPGYAGQKLVESTLGKIRRLRTMLDERGYDRVEIEVDGNVSFGNAVRMRDAGANLFVAGSSSVFCAGASVEENMKRMRWMLDRA